MILAALSRYPESVERRLPKHYEGYQQYEAPFRRLSAAELVAEIQDGPPERRLAALSVIDLREVEMSQIEDWIRVLPDAEVNELAGAIPSQRPHSTCADEVRWAEVARMGYGKRRLPTFLVMLFSSLEALESRECPGSQGAWDGVGEWLGTVYDDLVRAGDHASIDDISLFVFENYLDRPAIFDAFCAAVARHEELAKRVSANPSLLLAELPPDSQRFALQQAESAGGLAFEESWAALHGL